MAAENAEIEEGDTVAVWGCGPVGQFAMKSCWMLGAGRIIAIDNVPERLEMASRENSAETINFEEVNVYDQLMEMTGGRGPTGASMRLAAKPLRAGRPTGSLTRSKPQL